MDAVTILEKLTEAYAQRDLLNMDKAKLLDEVIPVEVKQAIDDINAEFDEKLTGLSQVITNLEAQAKDAVLQCGETIRGGAVQAVYSKGRVSWDGKKLDGMMALVPGLAAARKEGEPSVSLRKVG